MYVPIASLFVLLFTIIGFIIGKTYYKNPIDKTLTKKCQILKFIPTFLLGIIVDNFVREPITNYLFYEEKIFHCTFTISDTQDNSLDSLVILKEGKPVPFNNSKYYFSKTFKYPKYPNFIWLGTYNQVSDTGLISLDISVNDKQYDKSIPYDLRIIKSDTFHFDYIFPNDLQIHKPNN